MSRSAFPQIEQQMIRENEMRDHAARERKQSLPKSWTHNADEIARLRRALAQIAAGTVPHREGNTTAEDYSEFAADVLEAKA